MIYFYSIHKYRLQMFKVNLLFISLLYALSISAQHNMLGKSQEFITGFYKYDPEFLIFTDTLNENKILLSCKSANVYPYHTYEIDLVKDECTSYGFVSKNKDILKTYIELLAYIGEQIQTDSTHSNFVYAVKLPEKTVYYSIRRPYANSNIITRQNLFYILISEERHKQLSFSVDEN